MTLTHRDIFVWNNLKDLHFISTYIYFINEKYLILICRAVLKFKHDDLCLLQIIWAFAHMLTTFSPFPPPVPQNAVVPRHTTITMSLSTVSIPFSHLQVLSLFLTPFSVNILPSLINSRVDFILKKNYYHLCLILCLFWLIY